MFSNMSIYETRHFPSTNNNAIAAGAYVWELPEKHQFDGPRRKSLEKSHFSFDFDASHEVPNLPYKQHPINKRPLNPYGYPEWRYACTNMDRRAAGGSMYDILGHKWTHDWINVRRHQAHRQSVEQNHEYQSIFNACSINGGNNVPCLHPEDNGPLRHGEVYAQQERIDPKIHTTEFHQKMLSASKDSCQREPCNWSHQDPPANQCQQGLSNSMMDQSRNSNVSSGIWPTPGTENSNAVSSSTWGPAFPPYTNEAYGNGYQQTDNVQQRWIPPSAQPCGSRPRRMLDDWMLRPR